MQFMIVAYDGQDEGALTRRLAVRDSHIAGAIALKNAPSDPLGIGRETHKHLRRQGRHLLCQISALLAQFKSIKLLSFVTPLFN